MDTFLNWFRNLTQAKQSLFIGASVLASICLAVGIVAAATHDWGGSSVVVTSPTAEATSSATPTPTPTPACLIKGNINEKGEKIYHVPGGPYYDATQIDPGKGERMFCTEAEAVAAGWRPIKTVRGPGGPDDPCDEYEFREDAEDDGVDCPDLPSRDDQGGLEAL